LPLRSVDANAYHSREYSGRSLRFLRLLAWGLVGGLGVADFGLPRCLSPFHVRERHFGQMAGTVSESHWCWQSTRSQVQ